MNIINVLSNYFNPPQQVPPQNPNVNVNAKPVADVPILNLQTLDFSKLTNSEECKNLQMACLKEARIEWMKGAGYYIAAVLSGSAIIITAVFLSKVATFLIAFYFLPLNLFGPLSLTSLVSTDLSTALLAFYSTSTVWIKLEEKAKPYLEHSKHFYNQAKLAEETYLRLTTGN